MRVSVPNIPSAILNASKAPQISLEFAIDRVATFLSLGDAVVLTGAGVSVDSGIRAYRGKDGRYMNPNYKPIFFHELVENSPRGHLSRQRYWSRSYMGYRPVLRAQPNPTHYAISALLHTSHLKSIITQNVDGLHLKARSLGVEDDDPRILQLHGSLHQVHCRKHHLESRLLFQTRIATANPRWKALSDQVEYTGNQLRTNPDGDIEIPGVRFDDFVIPPCKACLQEGKTDDVMKPSVIFFGESIPPIVRDQSFAHVDNCERLLVVGTTLATYSAYRLVRHAVDANKPVLLLNVGPTRADGLKGVEKVEFPSGDVLRGAARVLTANDSDSVVKQMLSSGVVTPPPDSDDYTLPRSTA
ncbi:DHS-like NAD/FAD-binding domain-containing protein [Gautieria morchelliformis]|nr:DHS-like NAD/FAD-binding domain-containing protein [Gautieria morchelliformis]